MQEERGTSDAPVITPGLGPAEIARWLDVAAKAFALATGLALFGGGAVTLLYLFSIKFFPAGLTVGDSLLFFAIALGFGLIHLTFCFLGFVVVDGGWRLGRVAVNGWKSRRPTECVADAKQGGSGKGVWDFLMYIPLSIVAVLFLLMMWWATGLFAVFFFPLLAGMCLWIARLIWGSPGYNGRSRWQGTAALAGVGLFLVPVFAGYPFFAWEVQSVMQGYALRGLDVAVRLSDENLDNLRAAARLYAIPLEECASNAPTAAKIVKLEALLWHGIGERSLVEWSGKQLNTGRIVTVSAELKREGIFVIRGAGGLLQGCQTLRP